MTDITAENRWFAFESINENPNSENGYMVDEGWLVYEETYTSARQKLQQRFESSENLSHLLVGDRLDLSQDYFIEHAQLLGRIATRGLHIVTMSMLPSIAQHPMLGR